MIGLTVALVLMVISLIMLRISRWYSKEAAYWEVMAEWVKEDPELDRAFRPILEFAKAETVPLHARVRGWQPPSARMLSYIAKDNGLT